MDDEIKFFVLSVLNQLDIKDQRDVAGITAGTEQLFYDGFSIEDAVALLRNTEEVNPNLPESIALANMAKIRARHLAKKDGKELPTEVSKPKGITDLINALKNIKEISYSGHPDGREVRLEMITRIANYALETND